MLSSPISSVSNSAPQNFEADLDAGENDPVSDSIDSAISDSSGSALNSFENAISSSTVLASIKSALASSSGSAAPSSSSSAAPSAAAPASTSTTTAANTCSSALTTAGQTQQAVNNVNANWAAISAGAAAHNIDPKLLAAIAVRETGGQNIPETGGGHGMGMFQLTNQPGVTPKQAYDVNFAANYAANMLSENKITLANKHPNLTPAQLTQATAASYNFGTPNISGNPATIDVGTPHDNYGSNVVNLMSCFNNHK